MKKDNFIKYEGSISEFFKKQCVDEYDVNTVLIVPETHNAIIMKDGQLMQTFDSGSHEIFDKKSHLFGLVKTKTENRTIDVIYLSKTYELAVLWGTKSKYIVTDPITDYNVGFGLRGEFRVVVDNPRQFYLTLIGPRGTYDVEALSTDLSMQVRGHLGDVFFEIVKESGVSVTRIEQMEREICKKALPVLNSWIKERYGLKMVSFDILGFNYDEDEMFQVQEEMKKRKDERKEKEEKEEAKKEAKEIAAEIERLSDKQFERDLLLRDLEAKDYDKYLEVLKILANKNSSYLKVEKSGAGKANKGRFCPKCGHSYENGDVYCPGCGEKVGDAETRCPKCGKICSAGSAFCSGCGTKL